MFSSILPRKQKARKPSAKAKQVEPPDSPASFFSSGIPLSRDPAPPVPPLATSPGPAFPHTTRIPWSPGRDQPHLRDSSAKSSSSGIQLKLDFASDSLFDGFPPAMFNKTPSVVHMSVVPSTRRSPPSAPSDPSPPKSRPDLTPSPPNKPPTIFPRVTPPANGTRSSSPASLSITVPALPPLSSSASDDSSSMYSDYSYVSAPDVDWGISPGVTNFPSRPFNTTAPHRARHDSATLPFDPDREALFPPLSRRSSRSSTLHHTHSRRSSRKTLSRPNSSAGLLMTSTQEPMPDGAMTRVSRVGRASRRTFDRSSSRSRQRKSANALRSPLLPSTPIPTTPALLSRESSEGQLRSDSVVRGSEQSPSPPERSPSSPVNKRDDNVAVVDNPTITVDGDDTLLFGDVMEELLDIPAENSGSGGISPPAPSTNRLPPRTVSMMHAFAARPLPKTTQGHPGSSRVNGSTVSGQTNVREINVQLNSPPAKEQVVVQPPSVAAHSGAPRLPLPPMHRGDPLHRPLPVSPPSASPPYIPYAQQLSPPVKTPPSVASARTPSPRVLPAIPTQGSSPLLDSTPVSARMIAPSQSIPVPAPSSPVAMARRRSISLSNKTSTSTQGNMSGNGSTNTFSPEASALSLSIDRDHDSTATSASESSSAIGKAFLAESPVSRPETATATWDSRRNRSAGDLPKPSSGSSLDVGPLPPPAGSGAAVRRVSTADRMGISPAPLNRVSNAVSRKGKLPIGAKPNTTSAFDRLQQRHRSGSEISPRSPTAQMFHAAFDISDMEHFITENYGPTAGRGGDSLSPNLQFPETPIDFSPILTPTSMDHSMNTTSFSSAARDVQSTVLHVPLRQMMPKPPLIKPVPPRKDRLGRPPLPLGPRPSIKRQPSVKRQPSKLNRSTTGPSAPQQSTTDTPLPQRSKTDVPIPTKSTILSPVAQKSTTGSPAQPKSSTSSPAPQKSTIGSPLQSKSTAGSPVPATAISRSESDSVSSSGHASVPGSPKFETESVRWKGLTMDAAKWTFTSGQLQEIVGRAIRQSAEASSIRLLTVDVLDKELPKEIQRLEGVREELKRKYRVAVRRRNVLYRSLMAFMEENNSQAAMRLLRELQDVSTTCDSLSEDLYRVSDDLKQIQRLRDVHSASALAMALRKLNSSFVKQSADLMELKLQITQVQAERDEAWATAEKIEQDFIILQAKMDVVSTPTSSVAPSNRSSRVSAARKTSMRASKASLRFSRAMLRSSSSSASSNRLSAPGLAPPLPPMPTILGADQLSVNTDMPDASLRSPSMSSAGGASPLSEHRELVKVQNELYSMLGLASADSRMTSFRMRPLSEVVGGPSTSTPASPMLSHGTVGKVPEATASPVVGLHRSASFPHPTSPFRA